MTREQKYTEQLKALGIYQEAFEPEISTLAKLERDLQRLEKRWKEAGCPTVAKGGKGPPTSDKTLNAIMSMRKEVLAHRDALGLTPKGYNRLRPKNMPEPEIQTGEPTVVEQIQRKRREA